VRQERGERRREMENMHGEKYSLKLKTQNEIIACPPYHFKLGLGGGKRNFIITKIKEDENKFLSIEIYIHCHLVY
jgi:hypothetical protein